MLKSILRSLITGAAVVAVSAMIAGPAFAQKTKLTRLHRTRNRPARTVQAGVRDRQSRRGDRLGPRLDRRDHRARPRGKGQPARRRHLGSGRIQHRAVRFDGPARGLHAEGRGSGEAGVPQQQEPDDLDRAGRVARGDVLQHGRGRQAEAAEAGGLGGSRQSGLQGLDRDAQSGLVGDGLPGGLRVDPDHGREGGLGIHGQAAPEHRRVHALGFRAVRAGSEGRARDRHRLRHARREGEDRRRADRHHPGQGRRAVGHGSHGDHERDQEPGGRAEARGLRGQQGRLRALRQVLRDRRLSRA